MRLKHSNVKNPIDHVTITPFQTYDELLHNKTTLRAHEGLWINKFELIQKGLNRRSENGISYNPRSISMYLLRTLPLYGV